jgi:adenylate kinase
MSKGAILVTGTPCVGKTSVARSLASKIGALYVNLNDLAVRENLIVGRDEKRGSMIVDETRLKDRLAEIIEKCDEESVVIDGHYAASVVSSKLVDYVFVLRRDPVELRRLMEKRGFSNQKLWENLASEILDVCLVEALKFHGEEKICELNITSRRVEEIVEEITDILEGNKKCGVGIVDWLRKLEKENLLDEYMKF